MVDLFKNISPRSKGKILNFLKADSFTCKKNTKISSNLVTKNTLLYVEIGCIEIVKINENGDYIYVEQLAEKESFNFQIIGNSAYNEYEIRIIEDSTLIYIEQNDIYGSALDFSQNYFTQFLTNLLILTNEVNQAINERLEIISNKTIRNRLLAYFNINSRKLNSKSIYLPFSYSNFALYIASDRCAIAREMRNLKDEGLIEVKGRKIKLLYDGIASRF